MRRIIVGRFWTPPLFHLQSPLERTLNIAAPPLLWGVLCGLLSGVDRMVYMVGLALSVSGAFGTGRQHLGAGPGALRGLIAGTIFGSSVLAGHALVGAGSALFHPGSLQVAFTAAVAAAFAAFGAWSRSQEQERASGVLPTADVARAVSPED